MKVSASVVIYKEKESVLDVLFKSFFALSVEKELIVIDNSPTNKLEKFCKQYPVKYIYMNKNIGFGRGHNFAFKHTNPADIYLVLNPDIFFNATTLEQFFEWFINENRTVLAIPKVLYPNGEFQHVVRDIPTPVVLLKRKMKIFNDVWKESKLEKIIEIPFAHGCFFAFKYPIYDKLRGFDENFFMYMEDVDIWIRAKKYGNTLYNPNYVIYHEHRKASSQNIKLFIYHVLSAMKFFSKY